MRPAAKLRARVVLGGLASMGVVVAHALAYVVAAPDDVERAELLSSTGHGLWWVTIAVAMAAWSAALADFIGSRMSSARGRESHPRALYQRVARSLVALQAGGFILLEAAERWLSGEPLGSLVGEPVALIGLLLQVVVALLGAGILVLLARLIERVVNTKRLRRRASGVLTPRPTLHGAGPRFAVATGGATLRGPPALA
jgi:hypothetical protein